MHVNVETQMSYAVS